jgi:hypothetical protein
MTVKKSCLFLTKIIHQPKQSNSFLAWHNGPWLTDFLQNFSCSEYLKMGRTRWKCYFCSLSPRYWLQYEVVSPDWIHPNRTGREWEYRRGTSVHFISTTYKKMKLTGKLHLSRSHISIFISTTYKKTKLAGKIHLSPSHTSIKWSRFAHSPSVSRPWPRMAN